MNNPDNIKEIEFFSKLSDVYRFENVEQFTEYLEKINILTIGWLYDYEDFTIGDLIDTRNYGNYTNFRIHAINENSYLFQLVYDKAILKFYMHTDFNHISRIPSKILITGIVLNDEIIDCYSRNP